MMIDYTKIPELDEVLNQVEELLTQSIGRYQAQRFIALFCDLAVYPTQKPRNIWREVYLLGQQSNKPKEMQKDGKIQQ